MPKIIPEEEKKRVLEEIIETSLNKGDGSKQGQSIVRVYDFIDDIDVDELVKKAGIDPDDDKKFPTGKKYIIEKDGKSYEVNINLKRTMGRVIWFKDGFDAIEAIKTMPKKGTIDEGSGVYLRPEFDRNIKRNPELAIKRILFLKAIGAMLSRQEVLEAIVDFVPRKKDGTLAKKRIGRIASSMVGNGHDKILEITARTKDDSHIVVAFEEAIATPETYTKSCSDFLCTYWEKFFK